MAKLKPWYKVVTPREDLREGRSLDASEFAVHLDHIRDGVAHADYQNPARFFERTFLTRNLLAVAAEVQRRLAGVSVGTSAIYNMTTQFGGGKTHCLALLYHLARCGGAARDFAGVAKILQRADIPAIPEANTGIFVGTRFSLLNGNGGNDGTPLRRTPWGELAWQLGGEASYAAIRNYDEQGIAPAGEDIRRMIPTDRPALILIDEVMNYICTSRKTPMAGQMYAFLMALSEEIVGMERVVAVVSIPASELEMSAEDEGDYTRLKKMLDRRGKPVIMSSENETSEIIRRRLFEWDLRALNAEGRILLSTDAIAACRECAEWVQDHRNLVPSWFADHAQAAFEACYPFHPMVLSVFERKWRELPRFQQTRGVLRLLALWVGHAFQSGFKGAQDDLVIALGTAPLGDSLFRTAVFEQLGETRLEGAVTTDIAGKLDSHAVRMDADAEDTLRKARVHQKAATAIFFESNGGQGNTKQVTTVPEIRLAVAGPNLDIGNVETALEGLLDRCYYLMLDRNQYFFSMRQNLNKRFATRRAGVAADEISRLVRETVESVFPPMGGIERVFFPDDSAQVPNRPVVTLAVVAPERSLHGEPGLPAVLLAMTRACGSTDRHFKNAIVWVVAERSEALYEGARNLLAWEAIERETPAAELDETQRAQLEANIRRGRRDLKESAWRAYSKVMLLGRDNELATVDLGLVTSSSAESMTSVVVSSLRQSDQIAKTVTPRFLVRNWPPAKPEWSIRDVRDVFFASPLFPRVLSDSAVLAAIARGVEEGLFAYVGKTSDGSYEPFVYRKPLNEAEVELSQDMFLIPAEEAERHIQPPALATLHLSPSSVQVKPGEKQTFVVKGQDQFGKEIGIEGEIRWTSTAGTVTSDGVLEVVEGEGNYIVTVEADGRKATAEVRVADADTHMADERRRYVHQPELALHWSGEVPPQKWMNFYTRVLARLISSGGMKLTVDVQATPEGGASDRQVQEMKAALHGLGLNDQVDTK